MKEEPSLIIFTVEMEEYFIFLSLSSLLKKHNLQTLNQKTMEV
jgi:hypothetical protein